MYLLFYFSQPKINIVRESRPQGPKIIASLSNADGIIGRMVQADLYGENVRHVAIGEDTSVKDCDDKHEDKWVPPPKKVWFGMGSDGSNCDRGGNQERQLEGGMGSISAKAYGGNRTYFAVNEVSTKDIGKPSTVNHDGSVGNLETNINLKPKLLLSALGNFQNLTINEFKSSSGLNNCGPQSGK